jgi:hypothetical protein
MLLTDNPIPGPKDDEFGFCEHATILCDAIAQTMSLPLTVGIFGPWGSGKSSFLNICKSLLDERGFITVRFNPWKYDRRQEIWHAMIQSLLDELLRLAATNQLGLSEDRLGQILHKIVRLSVAAASLATQHGVSLATGGLITPEGIREVVDNLRREWAGGDPSGPVATQLNCRHVNEFEQHFAEAVKALTGRKKLAVFVDDLDRCRAEASLMALESLRLFTGDAPCIFVTAMDLQSLVEAASAHFNDDQMRGHHYLEKLINFPYHLPVARFESIRNALSAKLEYLADDHVIWAIIRNGFGDNPRRILRFVSAFNLALATLENTGRHSEEWQRQIAILLMLRHEHPLFFDRLRRDHGLWQRLTQAESDADLETLSVADRALIHQDQDLLTALRAVSPNQDGIDYPPMPTEDRISVFVEAIALTRTSTIG